MNDTQRNFLTAGIVCAASAALIGGMAMREKVDLRAAGILSNDSLAPGLVASRDPKTEIGEERYFYDLMVLLKREYVDAIQSETPLAVGSVKGMISSLDDEHSLYMSKNLFQAFMDSIEGKYQGIGANLVLKRPTAPAKRPYRTSLDLIERIPTVRVAYVAPNGPAFRAGLRAGDEIDSIDGRWVVNPEIVQRYRKVSELVKAKKLPESERVRVQNELRVKFKSSMMPMRAYERLMTGATGSAKLGWRRGSQVMTASVARAVTEVPVNSLDSRNVFRPAFVEGMSSKLKEALAASKTVTIDLRGIEQGDIKEMRESLALFAPAGDFGRIVKESGQSEPVRTSKGTNGSRHVRLLIDRNTGGLAEAFALALKAKGIATLEGGLMQDDPAIVERTTLPDGSGFTLRVGKFSVGGKA